MAAYATSTPAITAPGIGYVIPFYRRLRVACPGEERQQRQHDSHNEGHQAGGQLVNELLQHLHKDVRQRPTLLPAAPCPADCRI